MCTECSPPNHRDKASTSHWAALLLLYLTYFYDILFICGGISATKSFTPSLCSLDSCSFPCRCFATGWEGKWTLQKGGSSSLDTWTIEHLNWSTIVDYHFPHTYTAWLLNSTRGSRSPDTQLELGGSRFRYETQPQRQLKVPSIIWTCWRCPFFIVEKRKKTKVVCADLLAPMACPMT